MTERPPKFGDVYEWAVRGGKVRWFIVAGPYPGAADTYDALLLQGVPPHRDDPAMHRPTTIGIGPKPAQDQRRIGGER